MTTASPIVSIGLPVYNGERTLQSTLDSLLEQSIANIEIIISDNASTDGTEQICRSCAAKDARVRYIRQSVNIGPSKNFMAVLNEAHAPYFMWSASDDIRSSDFVEENLNFLESHPNFVASTSPNHFEGKDPNGPDLNTFSIVGSIEERACQMLNYAWVSHGIFYSLIRTEVIKGCGEIGREYLGVDWSINQYLADQGNINRLDNGLMTSGSSGASVGEARWSAFRNGVLPWFVPFYRVTRYVLQLSSGHSMQGRWKVAVFLLKLNWQAAWQQLKAHISSS